MTKKKLSDQINDWLRWESHSKTLADEAKKCGSNVTNDDTVSESEREVRSCKPWLVWSQGLSRGQASVNLASFPRCWPLCRMIYQVYLGSEMCEIGI